MDAGSRSADKGHRATITFGWPDARQTKFSAISPCTPAAPGKHLILTMFQQGMPQPRHRPAAPAATSRYPDAPAVIGNGTSSLTMAAMSSFPALQSFGNCTHRKNARQACTAAVYMPGFASIIGNRISIGMAVTAV